MDCKEIREMYKPIKPHGSSAIPRPNRCVLSVRVNAENIPLGHSDISTTANIYAHLDSQSKNLSARTMANTLTLPEAQPVKKW